MAKDPIVFALANPTPEILPDLARAAAPGAIIATGRSDFPNQVNNVLCFPFIFRGALDVGATTINDQMKLACIDGIAALARETTSAEAAAAYKGEELTFGPDYLIPKPFDPRLIGWFLRLWRRPQWTQVWRRAPSLTWMPTAKNWMGRCLNPH
jgi:malate dehydrogenase (oxaloacetate-decarboxylating)(NADP+)